MLGLIIYVVFLAIMNASLVLTIIFAGAPHLLLMINLPLGIAMLFSLYKFIEDDGEVRIIRAKNEPRQKKDNAMGLY